MLVFLFSTSFIPPNITNVVYVVVLVLVLVGVLDISKSISPGNIVVYDGDNTSEEEEEEDDGDNDDLHQIYYTYYILYILYISQILASLYAKEFSTYVLKCFPSSPSRPQCKSTCSGPAAILSLPPPHGLP